MSIQTLKKKGNITGHVSSVSGKPPGGIWLTQGPFGGFSNGNTTVGVLGYKGFSLNGGTRSVGGVGKGSAFSKSGTPFFGLHPQGYGGTSGTYPTSSSPVFNMPDSRVDTQGKQYAFIKPSVLSTSGMIRKRFRWIHSGQYPNVWVQPVYGNTNMVDNASQLMYIQKKTSANICVEDTNKPEVYIANVCKNGGACAIPKNSPYNILASAGTYTKTLSIPQTSAQYTTQIQKQCANPIGHQKPFPFATNTNTGHIGSNTTTSGKTTGPPPSIETPVYLTPPEWYTLS